MAPDQVRGGHLEKPGHDLKMAGAIYHEERGVTGGNQGKGSQGPCRHRRSLRTPVQGTGRVWEQKKADLPRHAPEDLKKNVFTNRRK